MGVPRGANGWRGAAGDVGPRRNLGQGPPSFLAEAAPVMSPAALH